MSEITEAEIERLSLIRYQLRNTAEILKQPPPINTLAINSMQDVVESTLGAVAEHVRAEVKARSDFDKLFDAVVLKLGTPAELTGLRSAAIALNIARVGFKHHGNQVNNETLRRHHDVAATLVHELFKAGFKMELDSVSLLVFIRHDGVRTFIQRAEELARANRITDALSYLRSSFDLAVDDYVSRKSLDGWRTIFDVTPRMPTHIGREKWGWEQPLKEVQDWVKALDERVKLSAMGIDLSRYAHFDAVAPLHTYMWHSDRGPIVQVRFKAPTDGHYTASYLFVVDPAVRLATSDFNLASLRGSMRPSDAFDPEYEGAHYLKTKEENYRLRIEFQARQNSVDQQGIETVATNL